LLDNLLKQREQVIPVGISPGRRLDSSSSNRDFAWGKFR
jgi:hypothetical protein